jgi:hypothetical protein
MNESLPYEVERMGQALRAEVERQLLADLEHYALPADGLRIDWSDSCQEGHVTDVLNGTLEDLSAVVVVDPFGKVVAYGWMDFIHRGGDNPLFVFWLFLTIVRNGQKERVKRKPTIPEHVWSRLPESSRVLCAQAEQYDTRWANDPLVKKWKRTKNLPTRS